MQKWGQTKHGTPRFHCSDCHVTATRKRKDNISRSHGALFVKWATSKKTLNEIADQKQVHQRTISRWFSSFVRPEPAAPCSWKDTRILIVDGTVFERSVLTLLLARGIGQRPISWQWTSQECFASWLEFFLQLKKEGCDPTYVVCDAQRGLLKALRLVWPEALVQRCLIHVIRLARIWLTRKPKTKAGCEVLTLVCGLSSIQSLRQKRRWIRSFMKWEKRYAEFLKERTYAVSGRWWYTHRKLRGIRSLLKHAIPELFRYLKDRSVPATSNHVEGGLNSRIKELLRCHRGASRSKQQSLITEYLKWRQN